MAAVDVTMRHMASEVRVVALGAEPDAARHADERLAQLEQRWSRFLDDSDITRLNRAGGEWTPVHHDTIVLLEVMRWAHDLTGGLFDPTVIGAVLAAGYTHSVADGRPAPTLPPSTTAGLAGLELDVVGLLAALPAGVAVDPGGIGKGLAADLVAGELVERGADAALVSIGGDLRTVGSPTDGPWTVEVEHPDDPGRIIATLTVDSGGVATSTTRARRFVVEGEPTHHVIDPRSGQSTGTDLRSATVVGPTAWEAEALATACLVSGTGGALALLAEHDRSGVLVTTRGARLVTPDLMVTEEARS